MAITLAEAKVGMADKVDQQIIDMFRRSSLLLDRMTFDNCISPGTGGSTLAYGYIQLKTPSTAAVRTINTEYTANEAKREKKSTNAIIMGGSFEVDRVLQNTSGAVDELAFQAEQKIKATANYFHNLVINGTSASSGAGYVTSTFDGLKKLLSGTSNEITSTVSLTSASELDSNCNAFLDELDGFLMALDGVPSMLLMNSKMLTRVRGCARRAGYYLSLIHIWVHWPPALRRTRSIRWGRRDSKSGTIGAARRPYCTGVQKLQPAQDGHKLGK